MSRAEIHCADTELSSIFSSQHSLNMVIILIIAFISALTWENAVFIMSAGFSCASILLSPTACLGLVHFFMDKKENKIFTEQHITCFIGL